MSVDRITSWDERLMDLGNVPVHRICTTPAPGTATIADVIRMRNTERRLFELVDGTLVEKAMGWQESLLAGVLLQWLNNHLDVCQLGVATGADGMTRLFGDIVRGPDVAYVSWSRLPNEQLPDEPIPELVPNFVIEVLSVSNTYGEMSRKRREYFQAGVELVWMVHPRERTVTVYQSPNEPVVVSEGDVLHAAPCLPDFRMDTRQLFARLDGRSEGR